MKDRTFFTAYVLKRFKQKNIFLNFVAIWHSVLLILFDYLSFVEYPGFQYEEINFGTIITTT